VAGSGEGFRERHRKNVGRREARWRPESRVHVCPDVADEGIHDRYGREEVLVTGCRLKSISTAEGSESLSTATALRARATPFRGCCQRAPSATAWALPGGRPQATHRLQLLFARGEHKALPARATRECCIGKAMGMQEHLRGMFDGGGDQGTYAEMHK
jgi:hypothetical protein